MIIAKKRCVISERGLFNFQKTTEKIPSLWESQRQRASGRVIGRVHACAAHRKQSRGGKEQKEKSVCISREFSRDELLRVPMHSRFGVKKRQKVNDAPIKIGPARAGSSSGDDDLAEGDENP